VTRNPSDALNHTMMLDQSAANTGVHPKRALVDAGYCSQTNRTHSEAMALNSDAV